MSKTPEGKVKDHIRHYMRMLGWTLIHIPGNTFSAKGSPDYMALKKGVCIFIEVKSPGKKLTDAQEKMREIIEGQGFLFVTANSVSEVHDALVAAKLV